MENHNLDSRVAFLEGKLSSFDGRFAAIEAALNHLETRIDRLEVRIDRLEHKMEMQFRWVVGLILTMMLAMVGGFISLINVLLSISK
jgi:uncharacterized coiled-coil protein SlyX